MAEQIEIALLQQYEGLEELAHGAYKAVDRNTNQVMTLKRILWSLDNGLWETGIQKLAALKKYEHHNLARFQKVVPDGDYLYLAYPYLGLDGKNYVDHHNFSTDIRLIKSLLYQSLLGVAHLHSNGVIHRDLRPQSFFIDPHTYDLKVTDFGVASAFSIPVGVHHYDWSIIWYRAPELLLGSADYSPAVDVWSLGCFFAHMQRFEPLFLKDIEDQQIFEIFRILGTPTEATWPGVTNLHGFDNTIQFFPPQDLATEFPRLDAAGLDLLSKMLCMDPSKRITVQEALQHEFFKESFGLALMHHYKNLVNIGDGVHGVLYKAYDLVKKQDVVMKKNRFGHAIGVHETARREISILQKMQHDNIIRLLDVIEPDENHVYQVFEYFDMNLHEYIRSHELSVDKEQIKSFLHQILAGVAYCHSSGIIHRDIKPQNILVDTHMNILKIAYFGMAVESNSPIKTSCHEVVNIRYRAPEILLGSLYCSFAIDVWSVGCVFAEMVSGIRLFQVGDSDNSRLECIFRVMGTPNEKTWLGVTKLLGFDDGFESWPPQDLAIRFPTLDSDGVDLLSKMLCLDPARRISAKEALEHNYFKKW